MAKISKHAQELLAAADYGLGYDHGVNGQVREQIPSLVYEAGHIAGQKELARRVKKKEEQQKEITKRLAQ